MSVLEVKFTLPSAIQNLLKKKVLTMRSFKVASLR